MPAKTDIPQPHFDALLNWLDVNREQASEKYERIRNRLILLFTTRGCVTAEDLADETINRVSRRVPEARSDYAGDPALYFYGVARKVHAEYLRLRPSPLPPAPPPAPYERGEESGEVELECLERCLERLPAGSRELIQRYYREAKGGDSAEARRLLAEELGIGLNALRIRMHRLRAGLRDCVRECVEAAVDAPGGGWERGPRPARGAPPSPMRLPLERERILAVAHETRSLLWSLIDSDWLGLHLLALLRSTPRTLEGLAAELRADAAVLSAALGRLVQSGAVEEVGEVFSCTDLGTDIIRKVETATGITVEP